MVTCAPTLQRFPDEEGIETHVTPHLYLARTHPYSVSLMKKGLRQGLRGVSPRVCGPRAGLQRFPDEEGIETRFDEGVVGRYRV